MSENKDKPSGDDCIGSTLQNPYFEILRSNCAVNLSDTNGNRIISFDVESKKVLRDDEDITMDDASIGRAVREFLFN